MRRCPLLPALPPRSRKRTFTADLSLDQSDVRFAPEGGHRSARFDVRLCQKRTSSYPKAEGGDSLNKQLDLANRLPIETVLNFDAKQICTRWHFDVGHIDAFAGHIFA